MTEKEKLIIYQVFPRIFTNTNDTCRVDGKYEENGSGKFADFDSKLLTSLKNMGVNCLWLTGVIEHATKTDFSQFGITPDNPNVVKGEAGSPYAIKDYYDVNPALAVDVKNRMNEFEKCVESIHNEDLKVIIDFVPNHTARVYHSDVAPEGVEDFGRSDDTTFFFKSDNNYYYIPNQQFSPDFPIDAEGERPYVEFPAKATGNDCFTAFCGKNDWYETVKLNYGRDPGNGREEFHPIPSTWLKMLDILKFWASKGVDGFRCDMVFMVPLAFWHWVIPKIKEIYPHIIFIGEIYDVGMYRPFIDYGYFDYLYDKVNLYDTLVGIEKGRISAASLTGCWQTVDGIGDSMLNFLENHDEVRFGSAEYAGDPTNVTPSLVISAMISRGPFMIYYGQELGECARENEGFAGNNNRTTIFDYWSYDCMRRWYNDGRCENKLLTPQELWLRRLYSRVLNLCNQHSAISCGEFFDLMYVNLNNKDLNPHRQFAFLRYDDKEILLIAANFDKDNVRIGVNIPPLAFTMSKMIKGESGKSVVVETTDLLNDGPVVLEISENKPLYVSIAGKGAVILKIPKQAVAEEVNSSHSGYRLKNEN